jgi:putative polyhydroxyalkanoate system protein
MANLSISIPHQLPRAEAKKRIQGLVENLKNQYGSQADHYDERWEGDTGSFEVKAMGMSVSGQIFVEDQAVRLEVVLPWMLSMMSGKLKKELETEGRKLLSAPPA